MNSNKKRRTPYIAARGSALTPREIQVLQLIAGGASLKAAADHLGIAHKSVHAYTQRIRARLGGRSLVHLGVLAERAGLLQSNPPEQSGNGLTTQSVGSATPMAAGGAV